MARNDSEKPVYMISVAAELAGVHPQTLRIYERKQLICPQRSQGNTRLYSQADIDRLQFIQQLTQEEGVNLAGVIRIMELSRELERAHAEIDLLRRQVAAVERAAAEDAARRHVRTALVRVRSGTVARRQG